MDKKIEAIPTIYRGVQLRSRLESQACLLFDKLLWKWVYEPCNYLLENGVQYRPDFWLPDHQMFVETRGYTSESGQLQLASFATAVISGSITAEQTPVNRFLILQVGFNAFLAERDREPVAQSPLLHRCTYCRAWIVKNNPGLCYLCGVIHYPFSSIDVSSDGKILINGLPAQEWDGAA